jgi:hypothetical protein
MISLASTSTSARVSSEPAETRPARADAGRTRDGFSAVLAQHDPRRTEPESKPAQAAPNGTAAAKPKAEPAPAQAPTDSPDGTAMPETAKAGKSLPVALPGRGDQADGEDTADNSDEAAAQAAAEVVLAALNVPQAALPAAPGAAETDAAAQTADTGRTRPTLPPSLPTPVPTTAVAGELQAAGEKAGNASVALHVAPQPTAQTAEAAMDAQGESDAPTARPRDTAIERAAAQPAMADTARQTSFASLAAPSLSTPAPAVSASGAARPPMQAEALQDLTRIVDRLAAAREAFAPATTALSIDHAEFGELSLRFDQRRDGFLSVQLSASTPDAQRAVAQAVGAQTFHSAADGQPQNQSQTQSQAQSQGQPQMSARGGAAERDGNGQAARHEQPATQQQQQRQAARQPTHGDGRQPAGIFA